jgi:hypothetical protein
LSLSYFGILNGKFHYTSHEFAMPIALADYLEVKGFRADPFETSSAENEADWLPALFVQTDVFPHLANDHCAILFAPPGHGKTSHRMEVARIARDRVPPDLVITFVDFDVLLDRGVDGLALNDYIDVLRRAVLQALDEWLEAQPDIERDFRRKEHEYALFCALLEIYFPERMSNKRKPSLAHNLGTRVDQHSISAREALEDLARLAKVAQFRGLYVLLDGFDEWSASAASADVLIKLLRPLLGSPALLLNSGVTFKFFLPQSYQQAISSRFRLDKIRPYTLSWTNQQLQRFLTNRLTIYSQISDTGQRGRVERLQSLCDDTIVDLDGQIVEVARQSPRRLIELGREIFEQHCRSVDDADSLISLTTIDAVLYSAGSRAFSSLLPADTAGDVDTPPLLFVDSYGKVFLDQTGIPQQPTRLPHRCLLYLWENRHRLVRHDELLNHVYSHLSEHDRHQRANLDDSLHKLLGRLRKLLEPGSSRSGNASSSSTYIEGSPTIGYRLIHVRDEDPDDR